jgi:uncharacterized membrane protein YebE (DUF533 family)
MKGLSMTDAMVGEDAEWILKTMVAMAAADGRPDQNEIGLIQQIYRDQTGRMVEPGEIEQMAEAIRSEGDFLVHLGAASKGFGTHAKEEIIRAAYLVLLADGQIAGAERKTLQDIAAALRVPEIHFGAILEDLAIWMAAQGR